MRQLPPDSHKFNFNLFFFPNVLVSTINQLPFPKGRKSHTERGGCRKGSRQNGGQSYTVTGSEISFQNAVSQKKKLRLRRLFGQPGSKQAWNLFGSHWGSRYYAVSKEWGKAVGLSSREFSRGFMLPRMSSTFKSVPGQSTANGWSELASRHHLRSEQFPH